MNTRRLFALAALTALASCGTKGGKCSECGPGTLCDTNTGMCVAGFGGSGGGVAGACTPACSGNAPVCDSTTNPQNPHCVQCLNSSQCSSGTCSPFSHTCIGGQSG